MLTVPDARSLVRAYFCLFRIKLNYLAVIVVNPPLLQTFLRILKKKWNTEHCCEINHTQQTKKLLTIFFWCGGVTKLHQTSPQIRKEKGHVMCSLSWFHHITPWCCGRLSTRDCKTSSCNFCPTRNGFGHLNNYAQLYAKGLDVFFFWRQFIVAILLSFNIWNVKTFQFNFLFLRSVKKILCSYWHKW